MRILIYLVLIILIINSCKEQKVEKPKFTISQAMSEIDTNFKKATTVREFIFPDDHIAHNDYKLEWWYFTGNLSSKNGNKYGYQFTIFRNALSGKQSNLNSNFAANQIYFYHLALTDISNNKFYYFEDFAREGANLAGTSLEPLKIWVNNSFINADISKNPREPIFNIKSSAENFAIDLKLIPEKPIVFHGRNGLSQKSNEIGNASYYYSLTRLKTIGKIYKFDNRNKEIINVEGNSWFDREWSTSALSKDQVGWDWFSIQLDDSTEIMYFKLRDTLGRTNFAKGTLINKNGTTKNLYLNDVFLEIKDYWNNDKGQKYPSKWVMTIPSENIKLNISTQIPNQELKLTVRYYEGSIKIKGFNGKRDVSGFGYVELTGYSN